MYILHFLPVGNRYSLPISDTRQVQYDTFADRKANKYNHRIITFENILQSRYTSNGTRTEEQTIRRKYFKYNIRCITTKRIIKIIIIYVLHNKARI